jgi:hypothetical protein
VFGPQHGPPVGLLKHAERPSERSRHDVKKNVSAVTVQAGQLGLSQKPYLVEGTFDLSWHFSWHNAV